MNGKGTPLNRFYAAEIVKMLLIKMYSAIGSTKWVFLEVLCLSYFFQFDRVADFLKC